MLPVIGSIGFQIPTYLLIISLTYCFGILWVLKRCEKLSLPKNLALDLCLLIMISGFVGARLFHVIFEYPQMYIKDPIRILYFWHGGFVFYGGFICAFGAGVLLLVKRKLKPGPWLDLFAPVGSLGYAIGRLSCLAAGCCYGKETSLPWAMHFPPGVEAPHGVGLHPTQIYSFLLALFTTLALLLLEKKKVFSGTGFLFGIWILLMGINRLITEQFRADWRGEDIFSLSLSSWISIVLILSGLLLSYRLPKEG